MTLTELRDALRKATGPDRDLDLALLNAIDPSPHEWLWRRGEETITRLDYGEGAPGNPVCSLDAYTASIDAAVTLVPEDMEWQAGPINGVHRAALYLPRAERADVKTSGATTAIALCLARLEREIAKAAQP